MDTLDENLLLSIISNINDKAIGQLTMTSQNMMNITHKLKNNPYFFKYRVENALGYPINVSYKGDWKEFYYILNKLASDNLYHALISAINNGNYLAIKVLIENPKVDPSTKHNEAIIVASEKGKADIVRLLLTDYRVDPSVDDNMAIDISSFYGHTEVVKLLLADHRVDPSANSNKAIRIASEYGRSDVVKILLADSRVDPSARYQESIRIASDKGNIDIMKFLLANNRVDPSVSDNFIIKNASEEGQTEVVKLLLGSNKIILGVKTQALKELSSKRKLSYDMIYDNIANLAEVPLETLIQEGNKNIQAREIIITKYFWWLRLKLKHGMDNIKDSPFEVALQQEYIIKK